MVELSVLSVIKRWERKSICCGGREVDRLGVVVGGLGGGVIVCGRGIGFF